MKLRLRMSDADRAEFGGEEWIPFDSEQLNGLRADELERIEKAMGGRELSAAVATLNGNPTVTGSRALVWLARYLHGLRTPWADFNIHTYQVDVEIVAPEVVDVPLDGSSQPSTEPE